MRLRESGPRFVCMWLLGCGSEAAITPNGAADASNEALPVEASRKDVAVVVDAPSDATTPQPDGTVPDAGGDAGGAEADGASEAAADAGADVGGIDAPSDAPNDAPPHDAAEGGSDGGGPCIDLDGDGYGVGSGCKGPDCHDQNPLVNPEMQELADDGLDNDCSAGDLTAAAGPGYYVDAQAVACSDTDPARGTKSVPYCSIEKAVLDSYQVLPVTSEGHAFFVAKGIYPLVIGAPQSIRLYGGYDAAAWTYDPVQNITTIGGTDFLETSDGRTCRLGPGCSGTCVCVSHGSQLSVNAAARAVIQGFVIGGGNRPSLPLFGVTINSTGRVTLAHNTISPGTGLQTAGVQLPANTHVWLLFNKIFAGTPAGSSAFGLNNLGEATLFGNVVSMGPGAAGGYGAAVQNYGEMRLSANVLNPGDQGGTAEASYGLINQQTNNPPNPPSKGTAYAVGNVIFGGRGVSSSRGVFSNSPLTLVNNVLGDRTPTPLLWAKRALIGSAPLDVGFASTTTLLNNVFANLVYSDEASPPNPLANRHVLIHSPSGQATQYVETVAEVNACAWAGCQASSANLILFPNFIDPSSDFHLPGGSPLLGAGTVTGPHIPGGLGIIDVDSELRPLSGSWDIGIDEQ